MQCVLRHQNARNRQLKKHIFRTTFSLNLRLVSMKLRWYADSWAVLHKFRGIFVRARPFQLPLGKAQQRHGGTRCGRGKYPVTPVAFEKTRLSAGRVLGCQSLSDRTLSPWQHKDNVVISLSSRLCLVCLLAKGNLLSGRPHTHTHMWVYTLPSLPEGSFLC